MFSTSSRPDQIAVRKGGSRAKEDCNRTLHAQLTTRETASISTSLGPSVTRSGPPDRSGFRLQRLLSIERHVRLVYMTSTCGARGSRLATAGEHGRVGGSLLHMTAAFGESGAHHKAFSDGQLVGPEARWRVTRCPGGATSRGSASQRTFPDWAARDALEPGRQHRPREHGAALPSSSLVGARRGLAPRASRGPARARDPSFACVPVVDAATRAGRRARRVGSDAQSRSPRDAVVRARELWRPEDRLERLRC